MSLGIVGLVGLLLLLIAVGLRTAEWEWPARVMRGCRNLAALVFTKGRS